MLLAAKPQFPSVKPVSVSLGRPQMPSGQRLVLDTGLRGERQANDLSHSAALEGYRCSTD